MNNLEQYLKLYDKLLIQLPESADVLVWLQGDRLDRGWKVLELYQQQLAKLILISGNNDLIGPTLRPGENNISLDEMKQWLLNQGVPLANIIVESKSFNTKEQSVAVVKLAIANKWKKIIIIGSAYYQPRLFLTFIKTGAELGYAGKIINQSVAHNLDDIPEGRISTVKQLLELEATKVKLYQIKGDVASYKEAINYLTN